MVRDVDGGKRVCNVHWLVVNVMGRLVSMLNHMRATLTKMKPLAKVAEYDNEDQCEILPGAAGK